MTDDWTERTVGSLCSRVTSGGTPKRRVDGYYSQPGSGHPWIKTKELVDRPLTTSEEWISESGLNNSSAKLLPPNTVLMAMYGATVGKLGVLEREMACNQAACAMIADPRICNFRYLFYRLLFDRQNLVSLANGAAQQNLNAMLIKSHSFLTPPLEEQRRIAGVLGALDDLSAECERLRSRFDELGRTVLRDRLVVDGFLSVNEATHIGRRLVPMDWVTSLIETGRRPIGGVRGIAEGVPSIGAESINGLAVFDFSKTKFVPKAFAAQMKSGLLGDRDLLVYKDGGKPGDFRPKVGMFGRGFPFDKMVINEHVFRVRARPPVSESYLYFWLQQPEMLDAMRQAGTGAAVPGLNRTAFKSLPVLLPDDKELLDIQIVLDVLTSAALDLAAEAREFQRLRDELLPLLMSGRVRVGEAAV